MKRRQDSPAVHYTAIPGVMEQGKGVVKTVQGLSCNYLSKTASRRDAGKMVSVHLLGQVS
jgi:hypothetical protein